MSIGDGIRKNLHFWHWYPRMLTEGLSEDQRKTMRVESSDEVDGRICAVVRVAPEGFPEMSLWLDDSDGRLCRLSFADRLSGREIVFEYSGFKKEDGFRFPSVRTISFDGRLYATETLTRIKVLG